MCEMCRLRKMCLTSVKNVCTKNDYIHYLKDKRKVAKPSI